MAAYCLTVLAAALLVIISQARGQFNLTMIEGTSLIEGGNLTLRCSDAVLAESPSELTYVWSRNDSVLSNSSELHIPSVTMTDAGEYTCTVTLGNTSDSLTVLVTVSGAMQGDGLSQAVVITVSVVLGTVGLMLVGVLFIVWFVVSRESPNIAAKSEQSRRRRKSLASQNEMLVLSQRSQSIGHLFGGGRRNSTFEDPYDRQLSQSTEQLLSGQENTVHPPTVESLDFDLNLDERLFESHKKAVSDTNLRDGLVVPIHRQIRPLPIDDLSRNHRKQSDPYTVFKPSLSQHSSRTNSASDLGDDVSDCQSQSSSIVKSVRFDLNDSGVATESSTPLQASEKRRSSAPDVKFVRRSSPRRGSAPEELVREGVRTEELQGYSEVAMVTKEKGEDTHQLEGSSEDKVASIVSLLSNFKPDSSAPHADTKVTLTPPHSRVSKIRQHFQTEHRVSVNPEPHFRVRSVSPLVRRSVSPLVSEKTKQLLQSSPERAVTTPSKSPGRLVGLGKPLGMPRQSGNSSAPAHTGRDHADGPSPGESRGEHDGVFEKYQEQRMSAFNLPLFRAPVSSLIRPEATQSHQGDGEMDSDSDSDDEVMVAPLKASSGVSNVSPFGKGMIGSKLLGLSDSPVRGSEVFVKTTPSRAPSRKGSVDRLSSIPEESSQGSSASISS